MQSDLDLSFEDWLDEKMVNLIDGRPGRGRQRSSHQTESHNATAQLVCDCIDLLTGNGRLIHLRRAHNDLRLQEQESEAAQLDLEAARAAGDEELIKRKTKLYDKIEGRRKNDSTCLGSIRNQRPEHLYDDVWLYCPALKAGDSGRIFEKGGGMLSCSRRMKSAAFYDLPDLRNIDMVSAHPRIAVRMMHLSPADPAWLDEFLSDQENFTRLAERLGVDRALAKELLIARLLNSGRPEKVPDDHFTCKKKDQSKVVKKVLDFCDDDVERANRILAASCRELAELDRCLDVWFNWLVSDKPDGFFCTNRKRLKNGDYYLWNKLALPFNMSESFRRSGRAKTISRLVSHLLVGEEQSFINQLTVISSKYKFLVRGNEHDGLHVVGNIPPEAEEEARQLSGVPEAQLIDKGFAQYPPPDPYPSAHMPIPPGI